MVEFLARHRAGVLMIVLSAFSLLCLTLRVSAYVVGIKTSVWFLFSPQIVYSGEFFNKLDSLGGRIFQLAHAEGENFMLREQNVLLSKKEVERDALDAENARLRALIDLRRQTFSDAIAAEVVGRDVRDWFNSLVINKGSSDGVELSAAVVAPQDGRLALVGRVIDVSASTSKVLLLTDAVSAISTTLPRTGEIGLVEGRSKPWVLMTYLSQRADVQPGDEIVTVGAGGIFPPGVPVGRVVATAPTSDGFFKEARVEPAAKLGSLREVLILSRKDVPPPPKIKPISDRSKVISSNPASVMPSGISATLATDKPASAPQKPAAPARESAASTEKPSVKPSTPTPNVPPAMPPAVNPGGKPR